MADISVIIPVYNGRNFIQDCINSLTAQDLPNLEIVFVDDGSTDDSLKMLLSLESESVRVLSQRNSGAGVARNTGLACATGEYVAFLDVDDVYANTTTLRMLYETAKQNHALICGGSFGYDEEHALEEKRVFSSEGFVDFKEYQFIHGFTRFIYQRNLLRDNNIKFPPYRVYEDPVFLMKAMIAAKRFYAVPDVVYIYSGAHQTDLNTAKTVDYIHGLRDCLRVSSDCGYAILHRDLLERLESSASYYAEKNLLDSDASLLSALIDANAAIDRELLRLAGLVLEENYVIPALATVWRAGKKYEKLRRMLALLKFWDRSRLQ